MKNLMLVSGVIAAMILFAPGARAQGYQPLPYTSAYMTEDQQQAEEAQQWEIHQQQVALDDLLQDFTELTPEQRAKIHDGAMDKITKGTVAQDQQISVGGYPVYVSTPEQTAESRARFEALPEEEKQQRRELVQAWLGAFSPAEQQQIMSNWNGGKAPEPQD